MENSILIIDDEPDFLDSVRRVLRTAGYRNIEVALDAEQAESLVENGHNFDLALIDIMLSGIDGVELLESIKHRSPTTECLMVTAVNDAKVAVECIRKGAYDYLVKPVSKDDLILSVRKTLERKRLMDIVALNKGQTVPALSCPEAFGAICARSPKMLRILKEAELHAQSDMPVLITGESGTGKELLARAIHKASPRAKANFTPVNMASLSGSLFDSEFFGHTQGAFTGASRERAGYLEQTNGGTVFLDEIGHMPLELQGKLLRVLQEGEYFKLGLSRPQRVDVRFIAATNADLDRLTARGEFRKDLYYRLKGAWLHLPPLRDRKEDIPLLVSKFMESYDGGAPQVTEETLSVLMAYDYPGNVRELQSILQSAANLAQGRPITRKQLPHYLSHLRPSRSSTAPKDNGKVVPLRDVEKEHILKAYGQTGQNKTQTAKLLGIGLNTLRRKLESYGLN
jgi:two-component system response regulator AtoC